jgi:LPS-assembly protein
MARAGNRPRLPRRHTWWGALVIFAAAAALLAGAGAVAPASAQLLMFPPRPKPVKRAERSQEQMLVRAEEINYDYTNERVSAVGNVQLYFGGSTLEADRVIYDQKTKKRAADRVRRHDHPRRNHGPER